MAQFYTLLTETGQAKMANAIALGQTIEITHLAVGDGDGSMPTPDSNRTALVNEVRRAQINRVAVDEENPSWLIVEQVLPPDVGGWTIREVGIFDIDGDLIGYGNYPSTYKPTLDEGSGRTQTIRMVLEVSHTSNITLRVDPSVVLATRKYADDGDDEVAQAAAQALQEHEESHVAAGFQFASYDADRTYTAGEITRGSDGKFYEFYDRDGDGEVQGVDPVDSQNRPHIWMEWDGVKPGATIEWRSETLPEGYIENVGDDISRNDYRRIFAAWGTTYGAGDGETTFGTPDDRGEFKRGWDNGRGVDPGRSLAAHQLDQMQRMTGKLVFRGNMTVGPQQPSGVFSIDSTFNGTGAASGQNDSLVNFDSLGSPDARVSDTTAGETRTRNNAVIWLTKI